VKPICLEDKHKTHCILEEAEEFRRELDKVLKGYETCDPIRGRVDRVLQAKLKALETLKEDNNNCQQKIQSAIASCREMAKLSPGMITSAVIQKKIEMMKKEMKEEVERSKNFLHRVDSSETNVYNSIPLYAFKSALIMFINHLFKGTC